MFEPPSETIKTPTGQKTQIIKKTTNCQFCEKPFLNAKKHEKTCKKNPENISNTPRNRTSEIKNSLTTTEILRAIGKYLEENKDIKYFENYINAINGRGKNGKFQVKLIRDTIIFLKELGFLT